MTSDREMTGSTEVLTAPTAGTFRSSNVAPFDAHDGDHGDDSGVMTSYAMRSPHTTLMTETTPDTLDDCFSSRVRCATRAHNLLRMKKVMVEEANCYLLNVTAIKASLT